MQVTGELSRLLGRARFLLADSSDLSQYPAGGTLAFARQLMAAFGPEIALVGVSTNSDRVGEWQIEEFGNDRFAFFPVARWSPAVGRPLVPRRLGAFCAFRRFRDEILRPGTACLFTQCIEIAFAFSGSALKSLCFTFPGVENPLAISRYSWARPFARVLDRAISTRLRCADSVLAAADDTAIAELVARLGWGQQSPSIRQLPTRFDDQIFRPKRVDWPMPGPPRRPLIVSCGRLSAQKGWRLLLDSFGRLLQKHAKAVLVMIGNGEERSAIERHVKQSRLEASVYLTGQQPPDVVAHWLNAADVVAVASLYEGWSVAILEALGCGKPVVTTAVSGASDMIIDGQNGRVVRDRAPEAFASALDSALHLTQAEETSLSIARRFSMASLSADLERLWPAIRSR